jgi:hypothetical protein
LWEKTPTTGTIDNEGLTEGRRKREDKITANIASE